MQGGEVGYLVGVNVQSVCAVSDVVSVGGAGDGRGIPDGGEEDDDRAGWRNGDVQGDGVGVIGAHLLDLGVDGLEGAEFNVSWGLEGVNVGHLVCGCGRGRDILGWGMLGNCRYWAVRISG
jgi:hypothetical protein